MNCDSSLVRNIAERMVLESKRGVKCSCIILYYVEISS